MKLYAYHIEHRVIPIRVYPEDYDWLTSNDYITQEGDDVLITSKGKEVFEPKKDLFTEFFTLFPHKVPDGRGGFRVLGTSNPDTIFGNKMYKKWTILTKGDVELQKSIIEALKYELNYKKKTGSLTYMQNMDTWFNQGTWEKYIDSANQQNSQTENRKDKLL